MPILDDARKSERNTWNKKRRWPSEYLTLAVVLGVIAFWGLGLVVFGAV
jgi:hypothetical protein